MKTIKDISTFISDSLKGLYDEKEIKSFTRILFESYAGVSQIDLALDPGRALHQDIVDKIRNAVAELKNHRPIQYITGETEFYGMKFRVNEHVLIPRTETEELVAWLLTEEGRKEKGEGRKEKGEGRKEKGEGVEGDIVRILDIGTGSGCIAVALKKHLMDADVTGIDISGEALEVAKRNAELNKVKIRYFKGDIFDPLSLRHLNRYNVIVSNPPYVLGSQKLVMDKNVLEHEPDLALYVSDDDALIYFETIVQYAIEALLPKGMLYFEINELKGVEIKTLLEEYGFSGIILKKDLKGKDRFISARLG